MLGENGAGGRVGGSAGNGAAPLVDGAGLGAGDGSAAAGKAVAVSVSAMPAEAMAGGAGSAAGGAVTLVLSMKVLLRAIKDEQGKSRGTRDALQRSMLC